MPGSLVKNFEISITVFGLGRLRRRIFQIANERFGIPVNRVAFQIPRTPGMPLHDQLAGMENDFLASLVQDHVLKLFLDLFNEVELHQAREGDLGVVVVGKGPEFVEDRARHLDEVAVAAGHLVPGVRLAAGAGVQVSHADDLAGGREAQTRGFFWLVQQMLVEVDLAIQNNVYRSIRI